MATASALYSVMASTHEELIQDAESHIPRTDSTCDLCRHPVHGKCFREVAIICMCKFN
jgi:hypothetical protein